MGLDPLTFCSYLAVAVVISSGQEGFGLLVCQNTSTRRKPLKEKSWQKKTQRRRQSQRCYVINEQITTKAVTVIQIYICYHLNIKPSTILF